MKRWKVLMSVVLSMAILFQSAITVYTPEYESAQTVAADEVKEEVEEVKEETDMDCDGQETAEVLPVSAGTEYDPDSGIAMLSDSVVFTDEQGNAIFNEQTEAALDEFTEELLSILEEYPPEESEESDVTYLMAEENLSGQQSAEVTQEAELSEEWIEGNI